MNILALDLSTKASGYAVYIDDKVMEHGVIKSSSSDLFKRMSIMKNGIQKLLEKYNIDEMVLEEVPGGMAGNSHTQKVLLNLQGVICVVGFEYNNKMKISYLQSSTWRSIIGIHTGRGIKRAELKQKDIEWVNNHYGYSIDNDDEADALALLAAYLHKPKEFNWG